MITIHENQPLRYRSFLIYHNMDWDKRPAPTDIYSAGKRKYTWMNPNYDGGTNDWGDEDTIEECVEQINLFLEHNHVNYPDAGAWSGGFAENH